MQQTVPRWRRAASAVVAGVCVAGLAAQGAAARPDPHEPNGNHETAVRVPDNGGRYQGSVAGTADADWYRVVAPGSDGFLRVQASAESPDCDPPALRISVLNEQRQPVAWGRVRPARDGAAGFEYRHENAPGSAPYFVVLDPGGAPGCERELDYELDVAVFRVAGSVSEYSTRDCAFARQDVRKHQRQVRRARAALRRAKTRRQRVRAARRLTTVKRRLTAAKSVARKVCPGQ